MLAVADPLTFLLIVGVVVLVITTTITAMGVTATSRQRRQRRGRRSRHTLSPTAEHTLEIARARAAAHEARALAAPRAAQQRVPTGQIIDVSDGRVPGREMSVEHAQAIAAHVAETDPQRVAEVINQWIRADSKDPLDLFR